MTKAAAGLLGVMVLGAPGTAAAVSPAGELVEVDCTGIRGWSSDPDQPDTLIAVHLYFDGPTGDPNATAIAISTGIAYDGCVGDACVHGYESLLPMLLQDDAEHAVHAYGIDVTGDPNLELPMSPRTFACSPPPILGGQSGTEKRHIASPEILGAWSFSTFFDRMVVDDPVIENVEEGPGVDTPPALAVSDDGDPTLWLLDQDRRRFVDDAYVSAWRFDPTTATVMPAAELMAMQEGTPLRPRPVLVQGTDPAVYLLDDHQCSAGDPHPSCIEDPEGTTTGPSSGTDTTGHAGDDSTSSTGTASATTGDATTNDPGTGSSGMPGLDPTAADPNATADPGGCGCATRRPLTSSAWVLLAVFWLGCVSRSPRAMRGAGRWPRSRAR